MNERILPPAKTRFSLVFQLSAIALAGFALIRTILLIRAWPFMDTLSHEWVYIFGQGLVYDLAFLSYFGSPFVLLLLVLPDRWYHSRPFAYLTHALSFTVLYGLGFSLVAEWYFWSEFGTRFNFISVDYLVYRREVTDNILESYPVFLILPVLFMATAVIFYFIRPALRTALAAREPLQRRLLTGGCLLLVPLLAFVLLNQSQRRFSDNNYVNELASNGPYQLFAAFRNNILDYQEFYATGSETELSGILKGEVLDSPSDPEPGIYNIGRHIEAQGAPKPLNVILISVESLSAKFLTRFGQKENITPFMDKWFTQGKLFTNFYATGTRTTRGLEAITLSIPPTPGRSIVKRPDNGRMFSLGKVFKDMGYDTAFLYGGRGFFDNMNAFFSQNGYRIVDQSSLASGEITFKNAWGVCDEDLYNRAVLEANKAGPARKPFFFHIMTTSNHQPFTFPEGKIDLAPGEGQTGSGRFGGVKYTDYALGQLIKKAKQQPWFKDTVFVVVADHCAASAGKVGLPVEKYHIPLFIYSPGHVTPGEIDTLASQIDLAPTLLSMLNFSYDSFFFGRDILSPEFRGRAFIANYQKLGLLTGDELLFLSPGKEINRVDLNRADPVLEKISPEYPGVRGLMSYYQGADYVYTHGLNRWNEIIDHVAGKKTPPRTEI